MRHLHVITAVSRPRNLRMLQDSLKHAHGHWGLTWWLVGQPWGELLELASPWGCVVSAPPSRAGQQQKNKALDLIRNGWVWVLDDDNIAHPDFFRRTKEALDAHSSARAVVVAQMNRLHAAPEQMRVGLVDQAQYLVARDFIGDARIPEEYDGDGRFIVKLWEQEPGAFVFVNEPLCFYNALSEG